MPCSEITSCLILSYRYGQFVNINKAFHIEEREILTRPVKAGMHEISTNLLHPLSLLLYELMASDITVYIVTECT